MPGSWKADSEGCSAAAADASDADALALASGAAVPASCVGVPDGEVVVGFVVGFVIVVDSFPIDDVVPVGVGVPVTVDTP